MKKLGAAALILVVACGKRGDPHPPVPVIPKAISDLVVAQRGPKVILSWSFPSLTTAGQKLGAIRRIVLYRYTEELPVGQPPRDSKSLLPGDIDPTVPTAVSLFAKVPPIGPQQFTRLRQRIDSIESADLPSATVGAKLVYEDSPPFHSSDGRAVRINYAAVTEGTIARSEMSNIATIVPIDVPMPPDSVTAAAKPEGIVLTWKAPEKAITGTEKPRVVGYNVYRTAPNQTADQLSTPVNPTPISKTTYTDVPAYGPYQYVVTAVSATGTQRIESDPSAAVTAQFKDLQPPSAPTGLTALVETKAVRLVWDAVDAPDLAGYRIWRTEGTGLQELKPVGKVPLAFDHPLTQTNYTDATVHPGISYFYEVSSVDKSGNESKPAKTDWVLVPKTP
ncbi:MAG: hypothetical protein M3041_16640 [Acidobacteriota bacterium]|nr:hypothetical protein [Acidobacteriota bacterium]